MTVVSKFASSNAVVTVGYTNPTYAYADDTSYATVSPGKGTNTVVHDFGFANFATGDIPDGATINSVTMSARCWGANAAVTHQLQGYDNGATSGSPASTTATAEATITVTLAAITLADLRSASTLLKARMNLSRTGNTAYQANLDWINISVNYTPPPTTQTGSFTVDAIIEASPTGSFTVDAQFKGTVTGSLTANAVKKATATSSFSLDAIRLQTQSPTGFTLDATRLARPVGTFSIDAVIKKTQSTTGLALDAVITKTTTGSFSLSAVVLAPSASAFTLDGIQRVVFQGSWTADAINRATQISPLTIDADVLSGRSGTFTLDAVRRTLNVFTLDARISLPFFTVDAIKGKTTTGSFTLSAIQKKTISFSNVLSADAYDSFTGSGTLAGHIPDYGNIYWSYAWGGSVSISGGVATYGGAGYAATGAWSPQDFELFWREKYSSNALDSGPYTRNSPNNALSCQVQVVSPTRWNVSLWVYGQGYYVGQITSQSFYVDTQSGEDLFVRYKVTGTAPSHVQIMAWGASAQMPANWMFDGYDNVLNGYSARYSSTSGLYTWMFFRNAIDDLYVNPKFGGFALNAAIVWVTHTGSFALDAIKKKHWWFGRLADGVDPEK